MQPRPKQRRTVTTLLTLSCFVFTTCGGSAWAESQTAANHPAGMIRRFIDDPRLSLSPEEKEYLRRAADRLESNPVSGLRPAAIAAPESLDTARGLAALGEDLEQLGQAEASRRAVGIRDLETRLAALDRKALDEFSAVAAWVRAARLPLEILERHTHAVEDYRQEVSELRAGLLRSQAGDGAAFRAAGTKLSTSHANRPRQRLLADRLPFRGAEPGPKRAQRRASSKVRPRLQPASPTDLEPNEDVAITAEIQALAGSLGNRPLEIYNWVRNHIAFVPTSGSVQGSQLTLEARRGNAVDTASLLIALLRAAGYPSRYVRGTIEVPADQVMNWVGGAANIEVAESLLGQGGVETSGLVENGIVTHLRLEHVWVETMADFLPGRGVTAGGEPSWVPLDASFKQHTFRPPSAVFSDLPLPLLVEPGDSVFEVDESLGKITNVNDDAINERLSGWIVGLDEYALAQGLEESLDGLLGGAVMAERTLQALPGSLPYRRIEQGAATSVLPAELRYSLALSGFASELDRAGGATALTASLSLPRLGGGRLGLSFEPATAADAAVLAAARENGAASLPVYLVEVVPVVRLDDTELARGARIEMGSTFLLDLALSGPNEAETISYSVVAGDEIVIGVTGNGVTRQVIEKRFADHPVESAAEYYHQVALHYWAECDYLAEILARSLGVRTTRLPSVGLFSSPLSVSYLFGAPRAGVYAGRGMDVRRSLLAAAGADPAKTAAFIRQAGAAGSFLEGSVFDHLENREVPTVRGISAMQLLSDAIALNVPIYRITAANAASALPMLELPSEVEEEVALAVSLGRSVMIPEREIDTGPWKGVGYFVRDETTGAGAYLISGGANGGGLADCVPALEPSWARGLVLAFFLILLLAMLIYLLAMLGPLVEASVLTAAEAFQSLLLFLRGLSPLVAAGV